MRTRTIWKFSLQVDDVFTLKIPRDAILRRIENGQLWAEVDPMNPPEQIPFATVGTGHPIPEGAIYRGTWFQGPFVWHLYELPRDPYVQAEGEGEKGPSLEVLALPPSRD